MTAAHPAAIVMTAMILMMMRRMKKSEMEEEMKRIEREDRSSNTPEGRDERLLASRCEGDKGWKRVKWKRGKEGK